MNRKIFGSYAFDSLGSILSHNDVFDPVQAVFYRPVISYVSGKVIGFTGCDIIYAVSGFLPLSLFCYHVPLPPNETLSPTRWKFPADCCR